MIVLGSLALACGACSGVCSLVIPQAMNQMRPEQIEQLHQLETEFSTKISTIYMVLGIVLVLPGIIYLVLGLRVRGGGFGAVLASIIFTCIAILFFGIRKRGGGDLRAFRGLPGVFLCVIVLAALGVLLVWLFQAAKNAGKIRDSQVQYQQQYMQYQQMMQQYGQAGYGYGYGYPPPPPQSPPGPPPSVSS